MSKKDRLKAQKEKQLLAQKQWEQEEREQAKLAKERQSKSAKKMMKKAKKSHRKEPIFFIILKILMIIPYGYSGFFYGGVLVLGIFGEIIEETPPTWVGWCALAGVVIIGVGILIAFFRKYIISFVVICAGTGFFMKAAGYMIDSIQYKLENYYVDEAYQKMDKEYMSYYYPILAVAAISLILLAAAVIRKIMSKKKAQYEKDTAPVKSIVE